MKDLETSRRALESGWQRELDVHCAEPLKTAMDYALRGGKHLRGLLLIATTKACGGDAALAIQPAIAVEMVHAASLVVDDLPAFDGSKARRGRPALHCGFGEAQAILAAHALVAMAFQTLSSSPLESARALDLVKLLSATVGGRGMSLGELLDLELAGGSDPTVNSLKTAILFQTASEIGGLLASVGDELRSELSELGAQIGCCYQALDDLEDTPANEADSAGLRLGFAQQLAATEARFGSLRSQLVDPAPLAEWLANMSALRRD